MPAILDRYLLRELFVTQTAVLIVLSLAVVGNFFARLLSYAVEGRFHADILLPLVGLISLHALITTLPIAVFLTLILTLGRLYKDSEMAALRGAGVGYLRLYRPLFLFAIPMTLASAVLSLAISPWAAGLADQVKYQAANRSELVGIVPGRFIEAKDGNRVFFVEAIAEDRMSRVYIFVRDGGKNHVVTAQQARQGRDAKTGQRFIVLQEGYRYEGEAGQPILRMMTYDQHGVLVPDPGAGAMRVKLDTLASADLWTMDDPAAQAEWQWRLSFPISVLLLTLIAQPLSYASPRQGRFGKLIAAVLVYTIYANAVVVGRTAIEQGQVPVTLGIWGVHALFLIGTLLLALREQAPRGLWAATNRRRISRFRWQ